VEWDQDRAFCPHTNNYDMPAFGVMLEDLNEDNGPVQVVPGSHKGPFLGNNGSDGIFCRAIDPKIQTLVRKRQSR